MAIKEHCGGTSWDQWPTPFTQREPQALTQFRAEHAATITEVWQQFIFDGNVYEIMPLSGRSNSSETSSTVAYDSARFGLIDNGFN